MPNADPNEFARKVLWNLCGIRAEVRHLRSMLARQQAAESGIPEDAIMQKWNATTAEMQKQAYIDAMKEVGIPPVKTPPPPERADRFFSGCPKQAGDSHSISLKTLSSLAFSSQFRRLTCVCEVHNPTNNVLTAY